MRNSIDYGFLTSNHLWKECKGHGHRARGIVKTCPVECDEEVITILISATFWQLTLLMTLFCT